MPLHRLISLCSVTPQYKLDGGAKGARRAAGAVPPDPGQPGGGGTGPSEAAPSARMMGGYKPGEELALLKEAKAMAGPAAVAAAAAAQRAARGGRGGRGGRGARSGGRGGRGRGRKGGKSEDAAAAAAALAVASTAGRGHLESPPPAGRGDDASQQHGWPGAAAGEAQAGGEGGPAGQGEAGERQQPEQHPLLAGVEFLALETHGFMRLWEAQPAWVVMYDPDVAFTRQLELYKASRWSPLLLPFFRVRVAGRCPCRSSAAASAWLCLRCTSHCLCRLPLEDD